MASEVLLDIPEVVNCITTMLQIDHQGIIR